MRQSEGAVYTVKVTDIQSGAYAYEYLMDEEVVTDPYTKAFTKENKSQVLIPEYDWEDDRYPAYAYKDVIAYSLHVRGPILVISPARRAGTKAASRPTSTMNNRLLRAGVLNFSLMCEKNGGNNPS